VVPFPSEYSTYTSSSGPQASFGTSAPAEPTERSSHFNDILQNLSTPAADASSESSDAAVDETATAGTATDPSQAADATPTVGDNTLITSRRGGRGLTTGKNDVAPVKTAGKDSKSATNPSAMAGLVTPAVTVLTPRPRATWSASSTGTAQNVPQAQDGNATATTVAATLEEAVASTLGARTQKPSQGQTPNANTRSPRASLANQPAASAVANAAAAAAADPTSVPVPARAFAAKGTSANDALNAPASTTDPNDPSVLAPLLAEMAAVSPMPQQSAAADAAKAAGSNQATDAAVASTLESETGKAAKTFAETRSAFINRGQVGSAAAARSQTPGAPSFDADDATENITSSATPPPTAETALATTLRLAAATAAAGTGHANAATPPANAAAPAQVPASLNATQVANATVTSTAASKTASSAPSPLEANSSSATAARPALTIAVPDLVGGPALSRALSPIQIETPASLPADVDASAVMSQIVQAMRVQLVQGGGTAQVTLQPGYLGGVTLSVKVDQDGVSASVVADTPAVRDALRTQEPALRDALIGQGLRLDHFDVAAPVETPRKNPNGGQGGSAQDQQQPRQQKRRDPSEPAFEFVA
jgi:flagellar hook-length control protein FliK